MISLPYEILAIIFRYVKEYNVFGVCKEWYEIAMIVFPQRFAKLVAILPKPLYPKIESMKNDLLFCNSNRSPSYRFCFYHPLSLISDYDTVEEYDWMVSDITTTQIFNRMNYYITRWNGMNYVNYRNNIKMSTEHIRDIHRIVNGCNCIYCNDSYIGLPYEIEYYNDPKISNFRFEWRTTDHLVDDKIRTYITKVVKPDGSIIVDRYTTELEDPYALYDEYEITIIKHYNRDIWNHLRCKSKLTYYSKYNNNLESVFVDDYIYLDHLSRDSVSTFKKEPDLTIETYMVPYLVIHKHTEMIDTKTYINCNILVYYHKTKLPFTKWDENYESRMEQEMEYVNQHDLSYPEFEPQCLDVTKPEMVGEDGKWNIATYYEIYEDVDNEVDLFEYQRTVINELEDWF